jgi:hypothetical protein
VSGCSVENRVTLRCVKWIWGAGRQRVGVEGEDSQAITPHCSIFLVMKLIVFYRTSQQRTAVAESTLGNRIASFV